MIASLLRLNRRIKMVATMSAFVGITVGIVMIVKTAPYGIARIVVEHEMSKIFKQRVTIDHMSGNLISMASFKGIRFYNNTALGRDGEVMVIGEATAHYNLIKVLTHNGDFAAGTHTLYISQLKINLLRTKSDLWNVLMILPPAEPNAPPLSFTGRIYVNDSDITIRDERGWGDHPGRAAFVDSISDFAGVADFKDIKNAKMVWAGKLGITHSPFRLIGNLNTTNGQWDFKIGVSDLDLDKWGPYIINNSSLSVGGGTADIEAHIHSKYFPAPTDFPFWYNLTAHVAGVRLRMPIFPIGASGMDGLVSISNNRFGLPQAQATLGNPVVAKHCLEVLQGTGSVDSEGHVQSTFHTVDELKGRLPNGWKHRAAILFPYLSRPSTSVIVDGIRGRIDKTPIVINGVLALDSNQLKLQIHSDLADVGTIKQLFPALTTWKIGGGGPITIAVSGAMNAPTVTGQWDMAESHAYGFPISNLRLSIRYRDQHLDLKSLSGGVYSGTLGVVCSANFSPSIPEVSATLITSSLDLSRVSQQIVGRCDTHISVDGSTKKLELHGRLVSNSGAIWMNQRIGSLEFNGWVLDGDNVVIERGEIGLNESAAPLRFFGLIRGWSTAEFAFNASSLIVRDIEANQRGQGMATLSGKVGAILTPEFWGNPRSTLVVTVNGSIENGVVFRQGFDHTAFDLTMFPNRTALRTLEARSGNGKLSAHGELVGRIPRQLFITLTDFSVSENSVLQTVIPVAFKPFSGVMSGTAIVDAITNSRQEIGFKDIVASGNIQIYDGQIRGQSLDRVMVVGTWDGHALSIDDSIFKKNKSLVAVSGTIDDQGALDLKIRNGTTIHLDDFAETLRPLVGKLSGDGRVSGSIQGTTERPNVMLNLDMAHVELAGVPLQAINGGIGVINRKIVANRLVVMPREGRISIDGYFNLEPLLSSQELSLDYDVDIDVAPMSLDVLSELIEGVRREWLLRTATEMTSDMMNVPMANVTTRFQGRVIHLSDTNFDRPMPVLYSLAGDNSIRSHRLIKAQLQLDPSVRDLGLSDYISGSFTGSIRARSRANLPPDISAKLAFSDASFSFLRGEKISLNIGSNADHLTYQFAVERGDMGGSPFDTMTSEGDYAPDGYLNIFKTDVTTSSTKTHSVLKGKFPLSSYWIPGHSNHEMDIVFTWKGNDVNMLALVIPHIKQLTNEGTLELRIQGPLARPVLSTSIVELKNAKIVLNDQMSPITSPLEIVSGSFSIQKNVATISDLRFRWKGPDTVPLTSGTPESNTMVVNGSVTMEHLQLKDPDTAVLGMNLSFGNATLALNFPQIYQGMIEVQGLKIIGPYTIPISRGAKDLQQAISGTERETGPVISGEIQLSDGEISMPTIGERHLRPNFILDVKGYIKQNVSLVGSAIGDGIVADVANRFDLSVAETVSPVGVSGTLNAPKIQNSIVVSKGLITLLNRQFEILSIDRQRDYFRSNQYKIHNNTVGFQTDYSSPKSRLIPQLNVTALAVVEPLVAVTTNATVSDTDDSKYTHVIVNIVGSAYSLQGFQFEKYMSSRADTIDRLEYRGAYRLGGSTASAGGDASEIAKILAPELLANNASNLANNRIFTQIGSGAINYISQVAIRGIERSVAQKVGLDDIQINYSLGDALLRNVPNQTVGVSLVKSLFSNQLYIRARTDVDLERRRYANTLQVSDVELTYYLEKYLSLNYSNYIDDSGDSKNRYNVKYSYEF